MEIKLKKLSPDIKIPSYAHPGDAGLDLFSQEDYILKPSERHMFPLGFSLEIPEGYASIIKEKSGLAVKHGLHGLAGVIDSGYRGDYTVTLMNLSSDPYKIEKGDKIAQLLIIPIMNATINIVEELNVTSRGDGAFGSTGKQ